METGSKTCTRQSFSTKAEVDHLTINGKNGRTPFTLMVALNPINKLYFHALTGYSLYAIDVQTLLNGTEAEIEKAVESGNNRRSDGMIFDANGNLYFADLEQNAIMKMDTTENYKFVTGEKVTLGR
jgi:sugar lactone lactonase YvrE